MKTTSFINTPLEGLNYSFAKYVSDKKSFEKKHLDGHGLPDYAYKMDFEHRKKLDSMRGVYSFAKKMSSTIVPQKIHEFSMSGIQVGPNQHPEIYNMVRECAETLGIGIPKLIITGDFGSGDINACTYACDDVEPVIIMTGLMVERFTKEEIKAVIGHECGHIHNNHTIYSIMEQYINTIGFSGILALPGLAQFAGILTQGVVIALNAWSRAAEVSADRAALICSGDIKAVTNTNVKLMYQGADLSGSSSAEVNFEALREQMNMVINSPYRINELLDSHPLSIKRTFADLDFWECEKLYEWRPDLKEPNKKLYTKAEIDERCKRYIDVINAKEKKNGHK
ncbi:MAG: M48 family metallopeptidase [Clostridia bacterium]|nr:M48 family metallopeptidase [Clostridia bacterium]